MARYSTPGKSKWWWVAAIADPAAPTVAEMTAGIDLTAFSRVLPNLPRGLNLVDIANLSSKTEFRQVGTRGGDTLTVEVFRDDATDTAVDTLTEDAAGFLVIARQGIAGATIAASDVVDVYPATVGAVEDTQPGRNDPDMANIYLVNTDEPEKGVAVVA